MTSYEDREEIADEEVSDEGQEEPVNVGENQCHLCRMQLATRDQYYYHIEDNHEAYFHGMMEVLENRSSLNMTQGVS